MDDFSRALFAMMIASELIGAALRAIEAGHDITDEELDAVIAKANGADAKFAAALRKVVSKS